MRHYAHPSRILALPLLLAACSDATIPPDPIVPTMRVEVRTFGMDGDPDGYLLALDGGQAIRVGRDTTVDLTKLAVGGHRVALSDVASWCGVTEGAEREFEFAGDEVQVLHLDIACRTTFRDWLLYDGTSAIELLDLTGDPAQAGRLGYTRIECGSCGSAAVSPEGERVAWITVDGVEVMNADGTGRRMIREVTGATLGTLAWSPDGTRLAYVAHSDGVGVREDIFITNVDGSGTPDQITDVGDAEGLSWSPDGSTFVFSRWHVPENEARLWLVDADGSNLRQLIPGTGGTQRGPAWSPDGQSIAYVESDILSAVDANGSDYRALTWPEVGLDPAWSPDGQRIAFAQYDVETACVYRIMSMRNDGSDVRPMGPAVDVCQGIPLRRPARHPAWGHDGT